MDIKYKVIGNVNNNYYLKTEGISGIIIIKDISFFDRPDIIKFMYPEESCFMGFMACLNTHLYYKPSYDFCSFIEPCDAKYKLIGYSQQGLLIVLNSHTGEQKQYCPIDLFQNREIIENINPTLGFYIGVLAAIKFKQRKEIHYGEYKYTKNVMPFRKR